MGRVKRILYLSPMRAAKVQASLDFVIKQSEYSGISGPKYCVSTVDSNSLAASVVKQENPASQMVQVPAPDELL